MTMVALKPCRLPTDEIAVMDVKRVVCWATLGGASLLAANMAIGAAQEGGVPSLVCTAITGLELYNYEEVREVTEAYLGGDIQFTKLTKSDRFAETLREIFADKKWPVCRRGPYCEKYYKHRVRVLLEHRGDLHVIGLCKGEEHIAEHLRDAYPYHLFWFPLLEAGITQQEALSRVPKITRKESHRDKLCSQCAGCPKAPRPYWEAMWMVYGVMAQEWAELEQEMGRKILRDSGWLPGLLDNIMHPGYEVEMLGTQPYCGVF